MIGIPLQVIKKHWSALHFVDYYAIGFSLGQKSTRILLRKIQGIRIVQ